MAYYYVNRNRQSNGDHEVHTTGCPHPPNPENRDPLGDFTTCLAAVRKAKERYTQVNGCAHCVPQCHTG